MGLAAFCRRLRLRHLGGALILRYHRVASLSADPHATCVSPRRFAEHLDVLARWYRPMALADLVRALARGSLPRRAVAVAFDDGYRDNLLEAAPLLERYRVPATVFVASGFVGGDREFWWDELERILLRPGRLPERLELTVGGARRSFTLGADADYPREAWERHRGWTWRCATAPSARHRVFREAFALLQPLPGEASRDVLARMLEWAGLDAAARPSHRVAGGDDLAVLARCGLVQIGAHSVHHPLFSALSPEQREDEIRRSKREIEAVIGEPVEGFAYPYGVTGGAEPAVEAAGYAFACGCAERALLGGASRFALPRLYAGDWDGDELARRLARAG